jgi:hypothetical protein
MRVQTESEQFSMKCFYLFAKSEKWLTREKKMDKSKLLLFVLDSMQDYFIFGFNVLCIYKNEPFQDSKIILLLTKINKTRYHNS